MKRAISEVNLDQLADLARSSGISAQQELPDRLQNMMAERRVLDKARHFSVVLIKRLLAAIKF